MTITFAGKVCAVVLCMERIFTADTAEETIQQQKFNERHFLLHHSHFKLLCWLLWKTISWLHDRFTLGLKAYDPKIHIMPLTAVDFQSSV